VPTLDAASEPPHEHQSRGRRALRLTFRLLAFLGAVALLVWSVAAALSPENREQFDRLMEAGPRPALLVVALSVVSVLINGLILWLALLPVRRISLGDVVAVNNIGNFLAYLPFKVGLASRFLLHRTRDRLPVLTIGAWLTVNTTLFFVAAGVITGVSLWRRELDGGWALLIGAGFLVAAILLVWAGRVLAHEDGLARIHGFVERLRLGPLERFARSNSFLNVHTGFAILAHPGVVVGSLLLRFVDLGVQAARFWIVAETLGRPLAPIDALLIASAAFFILVVSPAGPLGTREAGAAGVAAALGISDVSSFTIIPLLVHAAESVAFVGLAGLGVLWLRPDKGLLRSLPDR